MIDAPSPNHDERGVPVSMIVLHYTGMKTGEEALARLCDSEAKVSAHYMVERDGRVFRLVPEERRAWHAGVAEWAGRADVNAMSVGIEIVNRGHEWGYEDFAPAQMAAVVALTRSVAARHGVPAARVVGHADVAPDRKQDPGEKFPWAMLAEEGLAYGPPAAPLPLPPGEAEALRLLAAIGYGVERFGAAACLGAFQRRFIPSELARGASPATLSAIAAVSAY